MAARITDAGLSLIAELQSQSATLIVDKFIYAYIDGLDLETTPSSTESMPDQANIVCQADVSKAGYNGPDTVVYSSILSPTVGDFTFNWIGLYCSEYDVLVAVSYVPTQEKIATSSSEMGNLLIKNFAVQYTDVTDLTGVEINAETWQIDLTARLQQIDERERLSNFDVYGTKYFFNDAFLVVHNGGSYEMQPGVAYIDGIRVKLDAVQALEDTESLPKMIFLDTCLNGDIFDVEALWTAQISDVELSHYVDATNQQHYLEKIATINADGTVTDERGNGTGGQGNIKDHNTDPNAHPNTFDSIGAAAAVQTLLETHENAGDPHTQYTKLTDFVSSLDNTNGYHISPDGLIIQWGGTTAIDAGSYVDVTLPITFPHLGASMFATPLSTVPQQVDLCTAGGFLNNSSIRILNTSSTASPFAVLWLAIGH